MVYNRFSMVVLFRVMLILLSLIAILALYQLPNRAITTVFFGLLVLFQSYSLVRFATKINQDFANFLITIKERGNTGLYLPDSLRKNFKNIEYSFQQISDEIQKSKIDKITQEQFLQIVIDNLNDGLISFNEDGVVKIINPAAKRLLNILSIGNIRELDGLYSDLAQSLMIASPSQQKLIRIVINTVVHDFLFRISEAKIHGEYIKIVTFQDFKKELEEKEVASWRKLIRVLTHEIMNSITPITTLSVAVRRILKPEGDIQGVHQLHQDDLEDIFVNNALIEERSKGLIEFMEQYRKLTKIPVLKLEEVSIKQLLNDQYSLFKDDIGKNQINFQIEVSSPELTIKTDRKLLDQVLINLIKNAIEALDKHSKVVAINASSADNSFFIKVLDNGKGISRDIQEQIFIPFFTTKENGSGIGLSLCREIIQSLGGTIQFESEEGVGTTFTIMLQVI